MIRRTPTPSLKQVPIGFIPPSARAHIKRESRRDPGTMLAIYSLWPKFMLAIEALVSEDADPLIEDFAVVYATYRKLMDLGVEFDLAFIDAMEQLSAGCRGSADDPDDDTSVDDGQAQDEETEAHIVLRWEDTKNHRDAVNIAAWGKP